MKTLAILVLLGSPAFAQLPETPQPHSNKLFWSEVAAYSAANALDGYTTVRDTDWGYIETGSPYLYGRHPGAVRYSLVSGGAEVFQALVARKFERSPRRLIRTVAHLQLDYITGCHLAGAIHNLQLRAPQRGGLR